MYFKKNNKIFKISIKNTFSGTYLRSLFKFCCLPV